MEEFLRQLNQDIKDIFANDIIMSNAITVPTRNDPTLTFPYGSDKKGKILETCVLMIDIRNSTNISKQLSKDKVRLGKIYSAFIYAMTAIADEFGYVRNIVGDRIMVIFEPSNCFKNAVECASCMYTVSNMILRKHTDLPEFKVGIGIDYGEMLVLKTGIRKRHEEQSEYKNLVWVGNTANIASKLCDSANKSFNKIMYEITYKINIANGYNAQNNRETLMQSLLGINFNHPIIENGNIYINKTTLIDNDDFNLKVQLNNGILYYDGQKVINYCKRDQSFTTSPILLSGKVYREARKAIPNSSELKNFKLKSYPGLTSLCLGVYGGSLHNFDFIKYLRTNRL